MLLTIKIIITNIREYLIVIFYNASLKATINRDMLSRRKMQSIFYSEKNLQIMPMRSHKYSRMRLLRDAVKSNLRLPSRLASKFYSFRLSAIKLILQFLFEWEFNKFKRKKTGCLKSLLRIDVAISL